MKPSRLGRAFLVGLPFILTASTALVFTSLPRRLNADLSYVLGFVFYDLVWCLAIPLSYLGPRRFAAIFKEETPLFSRANWLPALLLITTNIVALSMYAENIRNLGAISPALIAVGIPATLINSTCEEILWRGLYTQVFPGQWFLGWIYPALGFALSHISPALVAPEETAIAPFVASTFFLGLAYGWAAYRTRSARWTAVSHSLSGIVALGMPLSTVIIRLLGW